jgi:hypothetical protein
MSDDKFTKEETEQRFRAALRGARIVGHKPKGAPTKPAKRKRVLRRKVDR